MSENRKKKFIVYRNDDNSLGMDMTEQEYQVFSKDGLPNDYKINIIRQKPESSSGKNSETVFGHDISELSAEEIEILREAEAEEKANNA